MTEIQLDYEPREQFVAFHERNQRWSCLVCHRRAGKTVACVHDLHTRAVYTTKKNARYGYIAPFYRQAKEVAWVYLKEAAKDTAVKIYESSLTIELFNGARICLYGADNPDALRGVYFDGVIIDEFGDCRPSLWAEVILPTLADRRGWAVFIGTPKGKNHFYEMAKRAEAEENWFHMVLKASESDLLPPEELGEMKAQMDDEQYEQELECSFEAAVKGTYYMGLLNQLSDQVNAEVPYDPDQPVFVYSDIGYTDSSAYWFVQKKPDGWGIIDYEEAHSQPLEYYFTLLDSKPYEYEEIWLPHDAKAKSLQTGRSTVEQFLARGYPMRVAPKLAVQDGIDAVRLVLRSCYFNKETTAAGVDGLRAYRRNWDEVKKTFSDSPVHDWSSHPSDAFRQFALAARTAILSDKKAPDPLIAMNQAPKITLNMLFKEHDRKLNASGRRRGKIN